MFVFKVSELCKKSDLLHKPFCKIPGYLIFQPMYSKLYHVLQCIISAYKGYWVVHLHNWLILQLRFCEGSSICIPKTIHAYLDFQNETNDD